MISINPIGTFLSVLWINFLAAFLAAINLVVLPKSIIIDSEPSKAIAISGILPCSFNVLHFGTLLAAFFLASASALAFASALALASASAFALAAASALAFSASALALASASAFNLSSSALAFASASAFNLSSSALASKACFLASSSSIGSTTYS